MLCRRFPALNPWDWSSYPPLQTAVENGNVFTDRTTDLSQANAAANSYKYSHFSRILPCGGHRLAVRKELHVAATTRMRRV